LANLTGSLIFVRQAPADELVILPARRVGKHRYSRRNASLDEVCRFEHSDTAGIKGYDNDVGRRDGFFDYECPSCGPKNRLPNGRNTTDHSHGQRDDR
jgi:hypothetical protein